MSPAQEGMLLICLVVVLLAAAVLAGLQFAFGKRNLIGDRMLSFLSVVCWAFIIMGILATIFSPAAFFSILLWIVVFIVVVETVRQHRRAQQQALLWAMAVSAEKQIPIVSTIEIFARRRSGLINRKAGRLTELLKSGVPLPDALEKIPGVLPARLMPVIRAGYESGGFGSILAASRAIARFVRGYLELRICQTALHLFRDFNRNGHVHVYDVQDSSFL